MPPYELPRRPSEPLKQVLARVVSADQIKQRARLTDVDRVWREAIACLPADVARQMDGQTFVRGLRSGALHVGVRSSAALCELKGYREGELLAQLQARLPRRAIRRLRFTVLPQATPDDGHPDRDEVCDG